MPSFASFPVQNVGTVEKELYHNDTALSAVITGCNVANLQASNLPVTVGIRRGQTFTRIAPTKMIAGDDNEELAKGKIVVMPDDRVVAFSNTDDAFDIILSVLQGV
jgi:hypothetical protein